MEQYIIKGGNPLVGEVEIGGAKNAALAILAAAIMTNETVLIENLPDVNDINVMLEAISEIGAVVQRIDRHTVKINGSTIGDFSIGTGVSNENQPILDGIFALRNRIIGSQTMYDAILSKSDVNTETGS